MKFNQILRVFALIKSLKVFVVFSVASNIYIYINIRVGFHLATVPYRVSPVV